jgi:hypothetical protein
MSLGEVADVFSALNRGGVRYLLVGGLAVSAHGHARATADIDLVVSLDEANALAAVNALSSLGYVPLAPVPAGQFAVLSIRQRWIQEKGMMVFQMRHPDPRYMPVDLFISEPFDFGREYSRAARLELFAGVEVPVVPLDILLRMKEIAGRPKDKEDIRILHELNAE